MRIIPAILLSVASVLSVRSPAQVVVQPPGIRVILPGPGVTVTTNGFTRIVGAPGAAGDITSVAVAGDMMSGGGTTGAVTITGPSTNSVRAAVDVLGTIDDATITPDRIEADGTLYIIGTSGVAITADESGLSAVEVSGISTTNGVYAATIYATDSITIGGTNVLTEASQINAANLTNTASIAHGGTTSGNLSGATTLAELADVVDLLSPGGGASSFSFHACRWVGPKASEYVTWSIKSYAAPGYVYGLGTGFVGLATQGAGTMESQFTIPAGVTQWAESAAVSLRIIGDSTSSGAVKYQLWILEAGSGDVVYTSGPNQVVSSVDAATSISLGAADITGNPSPGETYIVRIEASVTTSGFYVFGTPLIQVVP